MNKLKEHMMNPSIALEEFYEITKRKIILNFTVININKERLVFLNKNTMPNMPVWAAIVAIHQVYLFSISFSRPTRTGTLLRSKTLMIFSFISSSRLVGVKIADTQSILQAILFLLCQQSCQQIIEFEISWLTVKLIRIFQTRKKQEYALVKGQIISVTSTKIKKNYLNLSFCDAMGSKNIRHIAGEKIKDMFRKFCSCLRPINPHLNNFFEKKYGFMSMLLGQIGTGAATNTLSTLANSNDNLIMKWYYDTLIRLPIKIGTLDFNEIVDEDYFNVYKVLVLSEKGEEAIQRSYEITRYFMSRIDQRVNENKIYKESFDRYTVKMRVQLIEKDPLNTGFQHFYFKLSFLNHSKWNHNNYNNFRVQYQVCKEQNQFSSHRYQKINDSEVVWPLSQSKKIRLKFYYLVSNLDKNCQKGQLKANVTKFEINFAEIASMLPARDSYDYQFVFGWADDLVDVISDHVMPSNLIDVKPTKINRSSNSPLMGFPRMILRLLQVEEDEEQSIHLISKTAKLRVKKI